MPFDVPGVFSDPLLSTRRLIRRTSENTAASEGGTETELYSVGETGGSAEETAILAFKERFEIKFGDADTNAEDKIGFALDGRERSFDCVGGVASLLRFSKFFLAELSAGTESVFV